MQYILFAIFLYVLFSCDYKPSGKNLNDLILEEKLEYCDKKEKSLITASQCRGAAWCYAEKGNEGKEAEYYAKACNEEKKYSMSGDREESCVDLGVAYNYGKGVPQSKIKANELYQKGCKMGSKRGCEFYNLNMKK